MKIFKYVSLFFITVAFTSCGLLKPIEFKDFSNVSVSKDMNIKIEGDLSLHNPNNVNIKISKLDVNVYIEGVNLGKIEVPGGIMLTKKETTVTHVAVKTSVAKLLTSAPQMLNIITKGSFELKLKGTIYPESALLPSVLIINHKTKVTL